MTFQIRQDNGIRIEEKLTQISNMAVMLIVIWSMAVVSYILYVEFGAAIDWIGKTVMMIVEMLLY